MHLLKLLMLGLKLGPKLPELIDYVEMVTGQRDADKLVDTSNTFYKLHQAATDEERDAALAELQHRINRA